jgi:hypothetical protein
VGYSTSFEGQFSITPTLTGFQVAYLEEFADTRRMVRTSSLTEKLPDPARKGVGLPIGEDGAYYVGGNDGDEDIVDRNDSGAQPSLVCDWVPTVDGKHFEWDGGEKFYGYVEWLEYLIEHFFDPWGKTLNGKVEWHGDENDDHGMIFIVDNVVSTMALPAIPYDDEDSWEDPPTSMFTDEEIENLKVLEAKKMAMDKKAKVEAKIASGNQVLGPYGDIIAALAAKSSWSRDEAADYVHQSAQKLKEDLEKNPDKPVTNHISLLVKAEIEIRVYKYSLSYKVAIEFPWEILEEMDTSRITLISLSAMTKSPPEFISKFLTDHGKTWDVDETLSLLDSLFDEEEDEEL